jgi:hypothetical protein
MRKQFLILFLFISFVSFSQTPMRMLAKHASTACSATDPDACAFINATGIIDLTIIDAIDDLVIAAKAHGWWAKCVAIYPVVGGTLTTCSYNLKTPGSFQITWTNSPTVSASGVTFNGSSSYGTTHCNASSDITFNDSHISFYVGTNTSGGTAEMGAVDGTVNHQWTLDVNYAGSLVIVDYPYDGGSNRMLTGRGGSNNEYFLTTRTTSSRADIYINGSAFFNTTNSVGTGPNGNIIIGDNGNGINYSDKQCKFATIGAGINSTIQADMYNDILTFQTAIGR